MGPIVSAVKHPFTDQHITTNGAFIKDIFNYGIFKQVQKSIQAISSHTDIQTICHRDLESEAIIFCQ